MGLSINIQGALKGLQQVQDKVREDAEWLGKSLANEFQTTARQTAPWQDHTSKARESLEGRSYLKGDSIIVKMSGSAPYQEYLEFDHGGEYAIVYPMLESMKESLASDFGRVILGTPGIMRDKSRARARARKSRLRRR